MVWLEGGAEAIGKQDGDGTEKQGEELQQKSKVGVATEQKSWWWSRRS